MTAAKRTNLPNDVSRCSGDGGTNPATLCYICARREQMQHDNKQRWFPVMFMVPRPDGSCVYWIRGDAA